MARNAIEHLKKVFEEEKLVIFQRNNILCAITEEKDYLDYHTLDFISGPPQSNVGDDDGSYYTTVNAPWQPKIGVGDWVRIPGWAYVKNFNVVNKERTPQIISVTQIQFQYSTTGSANTMKLQGLSVK